MEAELCKIPLKIVDLLYCLGSFLSPGPINRLLQKQEKLFHGHFSEIVLFHYCIVLMCSGVIPGWNTSWLQWCFSRFVLPISNFMDMCWLLPPGFLHSAPLSLSLLSLHGNLPHFCHNSESVPAHHRADCQVLLPGICLFFCPSSH